jgi:hypothetical protein
LFLKTESTVAYTNRFINLTYFLPPFFISFYLLSPCLSSVFLFSSPTYFFLNYFFFASSTCSCVICILVYILPPLRPSFFSPFFWPAFSSVMCLPVYFHFAPRNLHAFSLRLFTSVRTSDDICRRVHPADGSRRHRALGSSRRVGLHVMTWRVFRSASQGVNQYCESWWVCVCVCAWARRCWQRRAATAVAGGSWSSRLALGIHSQRQGWVSVAAKPASVVAVCRRMLWRALRTTEPWLRRQWYNC